MGASDEDREAGEDGGGLPRAVNGLLSALRRTGFVSLALPIVGLSLGILLLFWPLVLPPLFGCLFIGSARRAFRVRRVARHPSSRTHGTALAALAALRDALVAAAFSVTGAALVLGARAQPVEDLGAAILLKIATVLLLGGAMVRHTRAMQSERQARVLPSTSQTRDRSALQYLLGKLESVGRFRGLSEWILGASNEVGPSTAFTLWGFLSLIAALGVAGHVDSAARIALIATPPEIREALVSAAHRVDGTLPAKRQATDRRNVPRGPGNQAQQADPDLPTAEEICGFDPQNRLGAGVPSRIGVALSEAWSKVGAVEAGCPHQPTKLNALWVAELVGGTSHGSLVVSSGDGRGAVLFGPVVHASGLSEMEDVTAVGPRVDIGDGDAQLFELANGGCALVARVTKSSPYIFLPSSVTAAAVLHGNSPSVALPVPGASFEFVSATGRRFTIEHDPQANRARVRQGEWGVPNPPCPRSRIRALLPR